MIHQEEDEVRAKRSLVVLCDLHRRKVWFGDRVANSICTACFHPSSRFDCVPYSISQKPDIAMIEYLFLSIVV